MVESLENEIWKVVATNTNFMVSNFGRVKTVERTVKFGWSYRTIKEHLCKPVKNNSGYLVLNGEGLGLIHRLVATAFLPNEDNLPQVNHIDENKENNAAANLEWCDRKYNMNYGTKSKRWLETCKANNSFENTKNNWNKPKQWLTPSGEIITMRSCAARRYHPDWKLINNDVD